MILLLLSVIYHSAFEIGLIPNGSACIYNEEYWGGNLRASFPKKVKVVSDKSDIVYYTVFNIKINQGNFFIGGGMKTYAQKHNYDKNFTPYRTRFNFNLGYDFNDYITIGFNHYCTHTYVDFGNIGIFAGDYEELFIRFEK